MQFAGINYLAVVAAAAAGFAFGATYYMSLGKFWLAALGKFEVELTKEGGMVRPMAVSAVAQLVMAFMMAGVMGHLGAAEITVTGGLISGFFIWLGFVVTVIAVNYAWQKADPKLTLIDGGHWLGVLLLQGLIIGAMGV